jgi:RNA polymerase sigma-70 factor (ECF subfamily)
VAGLPTEYDKDVIARAIARDQDAFAQIYTEHAPRVFRHLHYMTGNRQEADDLTSETFLRAWKAIDRYEDRGLPISNWLLRIGQNVAVRHLKGRRLGVSLEDVDVEADSRFSPEGVLDWTFEAHRVRQAILTLPDVQRQVIIWRFIEHMSIEEVEGMLSKSPGAIRVLQHRALKRLRETLAGTASKPGKARWPRRALRFEPASLPPGGASG